MAIFIHQFADLTAKIGAGPPQMGFQDLPHIHARRHAKRVQHQVNRGTIFQEGHVFNRHNAADHTLIPMAAGHLVTRLKLALHRDEDLHHLHDTRRQFVTALHFFDLALKTLLQLFNRGIEFALHGFNFGHRGIIRDRDLPPCRLGEFIQHFIGDHRARLDRLESAGRLAVQQAFTQARIEGTLLNRLFVIAVLGQAFDFRTINRHGALILVDPPAGEDADINNGPSHAGRQLQRCVAHIGSLFTENGAQQLFFRRHRAFALGRHLAHQNIARIHLGTDIDNAGFIQISQRFFAHIRNVAGDFFLAELRIARHHLKFFDMDRGEHIIARDAFADQDRIFEVIAIPRHEGAEHIAPQRQFAKFGRRTIGDDVANLYRITNLHQRALVDAGGLVGPHVFAQPIDINAAGRAIGRGSAHHNARTVNRIHHTIAARNNRRTRITRHRGFHASANQRRISADQRHRLTLHVGTHQRAVRVIVFQERNQSRSYGHKLLRRNVNRRHFFRLHQAEITTLTDGDQFILESAIAIHIGIGLRHDQTLFFHRGQIAGIAHNLPILHQAIRRFDEAVFVHLGKSREGIDQADIRPFRRFNRADAPVMRRVHIAHFKAGTFTRETTRAKR